jgi:hypothetical protein
MAKNPSDPVGTLSIGNVVTTSTILYKSNFKRYLQVSLRATGWALAIYGAAVILALLGGILYGLTKSWLVAIPLCLGWVAFSYFLAKCATDRAVICRLAYQELIDAPETVADATRHLLPRTWGFLRLSLLIGLYVFLVAFIGYIVLILIVFVMALIAGLLFAKAGSGQLSATSNPLFYGVIIIATIGLFLLWIAVMIRFYASWFIAELPLAIESTTSANFSIRRSRQLSSTAIRRLISIITIAFLITLPVEAIGSTFYTIGRVMSGPFGSIPRPSQMGGILMLVGLLVNLVTNLFVMPFWQTIKAIVYFDLRNRREGGDLRI